MYSREGGNPIPISSNPPNPSYPSFPSLFYF
jgi:hypothetical protein